MARMARIATLRWIRVYVDKPARLGILNLFDMSHILKITANPPILANPNLQTVCLSGQPCFSTDATLPRRLVVWEAGIFPLTLPLMVAWGKAAGERNVSSFTAVPQRKFYSTL
jgi:hypothetical protein